MGTPAEKHWVEATNESWWYAANFDNREGFPLWLWVWSQEEVSHEQRRVGWHLWSSIVSLYTWENPVSMEPRIAIHGCEITLECLDTVWIRLFAFIGRIYCEETLLGFLTLSIPLPSFCDATSHGWLAGCKAIGNKTHYAPGTLVWRNGWLSPSQQTEKSDWYKF